MYGLASSKLGLSLTAFNELSPSELYEAFKAVGEAEFEAYKRDMVIMRTQTVQLINIQLKKEDRLKDPRQLMRFDWEEPLPEEEVELLDEAGWEELDKKYGVKK